jgi:dTDP-4-amino-4,6-dideoxygalactose transaminase
VDAHIPFNRPHVTGPEYRYLADAVERGHVSGDGHYTRRAHELLAKVTGVDRVLLTTSCTHALEMAAALLDIGPGDEVILPSFTFVSTANAFVQHGATPVFVDIRPDTLNIDETLLEGAITSRTRAIVVVHYAGVGCEMEAIEAIAATNGLAVVEDAAHALGARYRGRALGSIGTLSTLSFHETKNIHCGEGGALLVNDGSLFERAEILREKGTNRSQFFRGQVDKYTWVDVGSSYLPSDLLAAFLTAQLEHFDEIQAQRMHHWDVYASELEGWAYEFGIGLPRIPETCQHPGHLFYLLLPDLDARQRFIAHLDAADIQAVFHYVPLHESPMGHHLAPGSHCPVTVDISERLVRLPLFPGLSTRERERVIEATSSFRP